MAMNCEHYETKKSTCQISGEICWRMAATDGSESKKPFQSIGSLIKNLSAAKVRSLTKQLEKLVAPAA